MRHILACAALAATVLLGGCAGSPIYRGMDAESGAFVYLDNFIRTDIISKDGIYLIRKGLQFFCMLCVHGELSILDG